MQWQCSGLLRRCTCLGPAVPSDGVDTAAAAGAWGVLRNMMQEFPSLGWAGSDCSASAAADTAASRLPGADAYGCAQHGGSRLPVRRASTLLLVYPKACPDRLRAELS